MINKEMMRIINSNPEMMKIINDYSDDENKKLKKLCQRFGLGRLICMNMMIYMMSLYNA